MSTKKEKRERKLHKLHTMHIWPSVLFLVGSLVIAIFAAAAFVLISLTDQLTERLNSSCSNAINVIKSFDTLNGNEEIAVKNLRENSILTESMLLYDSDGSLIAGFGDQTCGERLYSDPLSSFFEILYIDPDPNAHYSLYKDDSPQKINLLDKDGNIDLLQLLFLKDYSVFFKGAKQTNLHLFEARLWIGSTLSNGKTVIVKCVAPLYFIDFIHAALIGGGVFLIILLLVNFFFFNMLLSIHNQRRMTKLLFTDSITAGNSYLYFEHTAEKAMNARRNVGKLFLIADVTVLKYSSYCNYHGVHTGEALLASIDREISSHLGKKEFCAHSGKSSFVLFLNCSDTQQGETRVKELIAMLSERFRTIHIVFHAGIYFTKPEKKSNRKTEIDPADCLTLASAARTSLKDENTASVAVYSDKLLDDQRWEHRVTEKMQAALNNEEFKVYIQPKYDPVTETLVGGEALIRWINEEDGFISPGRFIPIFENNGFITKIDDYMISHVAKLQADWLAAGKAVVPVSVNVSRAHFANPNLAQHICALVDKYELPHHLLEIELTESAFFDDKELLLNTVHQLKTLGFEISMDDFGSGYSSLNSLKDLPLDILKLDAEFFRGESEENRGEIVVSQAIQLAKSLNMRIVAEGVEKKEQVDFLAGQGCDMIQGFYFAKPMPADDYAQQLK